MVTVTEPLAGKGVRPLAEVIDRWIYVIMAASFIVIVLIGFIPDSVAQISAIKAGERPNFLIYSHMHAVLMGSFLLLLLAQTSLMATGHRDLHRRLGLAAFILAPAMVLVGFLLVPATYHALWNAAQAAPPAAREGLKRAVLVRDDIMLLQFRIGVLFPLCIAIALWARTRDPGLHKRMMILTIAMPLPASFDRMTWLPSTLPGSPLTPDLYMLLAVVPFFAWDLMRTRRVHPAFLIWLGLNLPFAVAVNVLWDTPRWHALAPQLMGVS